MKKLWLISVLSLGLVMLAGCSTNKPVTITNSDDMFAIYNESKAMTCTLTTSDEEQWDAVFVIYFKDGALSQSSKITTLDWEVYNDYAVAKDGVTYWWGDSYGENGFSLTEDVSVDDMIREFWDVEDWSTVTCVKWIKDNSVFDIPSNVEFISADDLFWDIDYYDDVDYLDDEYDEYYNIEEETNEEVEEEVNEEWELEWEEEVVE